MNAQRQDQLNKHMAALRKAAADKNAIDFAKRPNIKKAISESQEIKK